MFDKIYIGQKAGELEIGNRPQKISRVTLLVDSDHAYTAGNDSGREIEVTCPWGSQRMAQSILARVSSYDFLPYSATDALLNPASEIGDGVTLGGIYSVISNSAINFDKMCAANISETGTDEIDDEYPYESRQRREFTRKLAYTRSLITKTAEEIRLEVQAADNRISSLSVTVDGISTRVSDAERNISSIDQYVDSITLSVSNSATSSTIRLMAGSAEISSQNIQMNGLVTFTGLANGTTTIDGACIKTGEIEANRLNLTGAILFSDLSEGVQMDIEEAYNMAENAQSLAEDVDDTVAGWRYRGTTYIDGTMLMTGTVMASELLGGTVGLLDANENIVGGIDITNTQTGYGLDFWTYYGGVRISAGGNFWVDADYGSFGLTSSGLVSEADVVPESSSSYSLGLSGKRWTDVYADNSTIQTSDLQIKKDVEYGLSGYDGFFDALRPMSFRFVNGTSGRRHMGFGAQDVEKALSEFGISTQDFAGFVKSPGVDDAGQVIEGKWEYALRYGEWIPLCVDQIQKLKKRVSELEKGGLS